VRVYLAAASSDLHRVETWSRHLREAGVEVTSDWPEIIRKAGAANPRDVAQEQRQVWSDHDLDQVLEADIVWFLVPHDDTPARGAYFEAGYAIGQGWRVIFSGDTKQSIFCAQGREFEQDAFAFEYLLSLARGGT
jgi:nucleoside 2-deoxyribosyltransferase